MTGTSTCAKCGNGSFKLVMKEPAGSNFKVNFVQCSSCNSPIGVLEYKSIGKLMDEQGAKIKKIG